MFTFPVSKFLPTEIDLLPENFSNWLNLLKVQSNHHAHGLNELAHYLQLLKPNLQLFSIIKLKRHFRGQINAFLWHKNLKCQEAFFHVKTIDKQSIRCAFSHKLLNFNNYLRYSSLSLRQKQTVIICLWKKIDITIKQEKIRRDFRRSLRNCATYPKCHLPNVPFTKYPRCHLVFLINWTMKFKIISPLVGSVPLIRRWISPLEK